MIKSHVMFLGFTVLFPNTSVVACDLSLTILPHTDRLVFGDPLYIEVTFTNTGERPVAGPPPDLIFGTLRFMIWDAEAQLCYRTSAGGGMMGGMSMRVFEPHTSVKYYFTLMFPRYARFGHEFWSRYVDGGEASVQAVYYPNPGGGMIDKPSKDVRAVAPPGGQIVSDVHRLSLEPRPKWQIERLQLWAEREINPKDYRKGPSLPDFHLPVHVANREEMSSFAFDTVLDGELGGLVVLGLKFRDIYELPPATRDAANRKLVEWLRKEPEWKHTGAFYMIPGSEGGLERVLLRPEVKRKALAHMLEETARNYNMPSTAEAMKEIIEEGQETGELKDGETKEAEGPKAP